MICFTNATSPPTTMLSCGAAVLTDFGSGRSSDRLVNMPHASRLLPKKGGLHMQKSYVSPTSTTPHSFVFEDTCNTVDTSCSAFLATLRFAYSVLKSSASVARNFHEFFLAASSGYTHDAPVPGRTFKGILQ
ncbi:hypothetical protein NP493_401g00003 [Ridgeia piscesae]|uniref:Uncharacterized protein n=1 Tax=Ridgeia piscesae TaxID=27915 RepID=A0AAD9L1J6_RIDPI|nr:hypothetical protein NP493_401g00003 [Ridgeia piscesae]